MPAKSAKATTVSKPTYAVMVAESIKTLDDRTGSSLQAITKQLISSYGIDVNKTALATAIKKGVESGDLVKVKASFKIGKKKPAVKPSAVKPKVTKKPAKKKAAPAKAAITKKADTVKKTKTAKAAATKPKKTIKKTTTKRAPTKKAAPAKSTTAKSTTAKTKATAAKKGKK